MYRLSKYLLIAAGLVLLPAAAFAQASIVGTVRDASGAVLPGVTVEASSPALIEKTRAVTTNDVGQYSIDDLRPGTYTVAFTLSGFAPVKREGVVLSGTFIATVNQDLKVGGVSEAITVTGEPPVVDVTSARTEHTFSGETVADIPSGRQYFSFTALVPAINVQGNDVGASSGPIFSVFQIHGGRRNEGQVQVNGQSAGYQGMGVSGYTPEVGNAQEINVTLSGALAEAVTGGPQVNVISKQGGNTFSGSMFFNFANSSFQGDNLSAAQIGTGLTPQSLEKLWDVNPSFGGPVMRDRLWFFTSFRHQGNRQKVNMFTNANAGDATKWTYVPTATQAIDDGTWKNYSGRLTWQASARNKFDGFMNVQYNCQHCIEGGSRSGLSFTGLIAAPEGQQTNENHPSMLGKIGWSSPVTNRMLLEASWGLGPYFWWGSQQKNSFDQTLIPVQDDGGPIPGINYRAANWSGHTAFTNIYEGALSYVTGSHSAKFGARYHTNDSTFPKNYYNDSQLKYNFGERPPAYALPGTGTVPYQLTMYADQGSDQHQHQGIFALYAQDRWTHGRLTLQGGLRFELLRDSFDRQQMGPNIFVPVPVVFEAQDGPLHQKDLMPRFGLAYDVFGNGKTAAKFFMGKYVTTANTVDEWINYSPAGLGGFVDSTTRAWRDDTFGAGDSRSGNFVADCNLLNPVANGECGPMANPNFGKAVARFLTVDPDVTDGWNAREYSWDLNVGIVQEVAPRVSVELAYVRRTWGNMQATVNRAVTPADFDPFVYNVASDPKLPGGGGYPLTFYDIKPAKFGQFDNYRTFTDNLGGVDNRYHGVDMTAHARLRDVTIQGGFSTGNRLEDDCGLVSAHPEVYIFAPWGGSSPFLADSPFVGGLGQWPQAFCHRESGWQQSWKGLASYTVPRIDVLVSGTFRSVPFAGADFPSIAGQSLNAQVTAVQIPGVFAETNLGRMFSSGIPVQFLNLVEPGTLYGERLNNVDLRFGKVVRYNRTRTLVALDIYNVGNSNTPDGYLQTYGTTYLNPVSVTAARLFKISAQFDF
jgi:hypothetical protein